MYIKELHIDSFGGIRDMTLELLPGLNIVEGVNESGKSSVAMFIKFILYGLSGRGTDGALSERRRCVSWETGSAAGYIVFVREDKTYRVQRELYVSSADTEGTAAEAVRERVSITDESTGERVFKGQVPGVALLSMTEQMFCNSVFVRQLTDAKIDGAGMAEAIENILYSGDEGVSTRRAAAVLDKSRKLLLHKNGSGGKIYEKRREIAALEAELEEARRKNAEIIDLEAAVADSAALIEARERQAESYSALLEAYEALDRRRRLDELEKCEAEEERLKLLLDSYPPEEETEEHCEQLRRTVMERGETELRLKAVRMKEAALDQSLPPLMSEEEKEKIRQEAAQSQRLAAKKKSCFGFSLALFIIAALCGAVGLFLWGTDKYIAAAALGTCGAGAVAGAVLLCVSLRALKKLNALLDRWNAPDVSQMQDITEEHIHKNSMFRSDGSELCRLASEEAEISRGREELLSRQRILAGRFAEEEPDTDTMTEKALAKASALLKEQKEITAELNTVRGRLSALERPDAAEREKIRREAEATGAGEAGKRASQLSRAEKEKAQRDRGFFLSTAGAQRARHTELEKKLSALTATAASPSEIAGRLEAASEELARAQAQYRGLVGAMEALEKAGESLRASLMPRIVSEAGVLLGAFTGGKYTGLGVERDFSMSFMPGGYTRESDYMSAGTRDAAYISLRCALAKVLFEDNPPPAIYDESFTRIDENRLKRLLSILRAAGEEGVQSIVLTCRAAEGSLAEGVPVIRL